MIPKIIHQTWKDENIPEKWKKAQQDWLNLHPGWEYMLWTDKKIREYISTRHPDYLALHDSYEYPIQRADMIRYFVLYDYGGVYCDMDMYPMKNIEPYLLNDIDYFVYSANGDVITNCFMISRKNSLIMKKIQENLKKDIPWFAIGKHLHVLYSTGPLLVNHTLLNDITEPFAILPRRLFNPYSIVNDDHITDIKESYINTVDSSSTWNGYDTSIYNFIAKYRTFFIVLGIVSLILIIFFLIHYISKYKKCRESKESCERSCVKK